MGKSEVMTGNEAAAIAAVLSRAQVVSTCPTAQQAELVNSLAARCCGEGAGARFIEAESERSALAVLVGASSAGARTFTAAASQSLASAHELLFWAAYARLPIVLACANSAIGPGFNMWSDTTDSAAQRDTGWIQLYCETNQEVLDSIIIAYRLAEEVSLPVMVNYDAFVLSHTYETVELPEQKEVDGYLGERKASPVLDTAEPRTFGPYTGPDHYMEFRRIMEEAHEGAGRAFENAAKDFARSFHRRYSAVERIFTKGSEVVIVAAGSIAGTARAACERMRKGGELAGFVKMRMMRPSPTEAIREAVGNRAGAAMTRRLAVIDRSAAHGSAGPWAHDIRAALAGMRGAPKVIGIHAGLGGRDVCIDDIENAYEQVKIAKDGVETIWVGFEK